MDYTLYSMSYRHSVDLLEAHVFARAYQSAWRALYFCDPVGRHVIESLDLVVDFGVSVSERPGYDGAATLVV